MHVPQINDVSLFWSLNAWSLLGGFSLSGYGNSAGDKIASGLAPVGNTVGRGLEIGAAPIGGLVEPLVGGIMKSGKGFGEATGVGAGNNPDTFGKKQVPNDEDDQIAGKEQNAENPLGLQKP